MPHAYSIKCLRSIWRYCSFIGVAETNLFGLLFVADSFIYNLDSQQLTARCKRCLRFIDQAQANERIWTKGGETPIMMIAGQSSELSH